MAYGKMKGGYGGMKGGSYGKMRGSSGGGVGTRYTSGDKAPRTAHGTQPATKKSPTTRGPRGKMGY